MILPLSHFSPDGDEGYPGNLVASVTYALRRFDGRVEVTFKAMAFTRRIGWKKMKK